MKMTPELRNSATRKNEAADFHIKKDSEQRVTTPLGNTGYGVGKELVKGLVAVVNPWRCMGLEVIMDMIGFSVETNPSACLHRDIFSSET